jgi:peptidoglycan-N-acetylglucosamine deacetylase
MQTFPVYEGNRSIPMISFVVNVAWGNEYLVDLLTYLKLKNIRLTFFLEGRWVKTFPEKARLIKEFNQEIGNHAYSHPDMRTLTIEEISDEIKKTNEALVETLNIHPEYFSPPYGYYDERVISTASSLNMSTILWSLDTLDWKIKSPEEIIERIVPNLANGSIILMHPTAGSLKALPKMIDAAMEKGYSIGCISDVIK